ncbi:MAG: hypothetical protein HC904_06470 [Blastochloris sp.]|nr:hypothetical protein [Blastochloris sp.]
MSGAEGGRYIGAVNCSTSGCHGGAGDLSKQHTIWFRADRHSRAHSSLTTARSARMAESLKIENPATDSRCTSCHAPMLALPAARKTETLRPEEGVSCESCHGASENWVRSHTRTDYSRSQRISSGLRDLEDLYLRSNTCVACHQVIDQDLVAAGHPRLHFDQAGLSDREPRHWKEIWGQPQLWAVGQFAALRELSGHLAQKQSKQQKINPQEQADWESSLWLCQQILQTLPLENPSSLSSPAQATMELTRQSDQLTRLSSKKIWPKDWDLKLQEALQNIQSELKKTSRQDQLSQKLKLEKVERALQSLALTR